MSDRMTGRLREAFGVEPAGRDPAGRPRVAPDSTAGLGRGLALAAAEGWKVRIEGQGSWLQPDAPADLALLTTGLDRITRIAADDLVATVEAGVRLGTLSAGLRQAGMWLPWEPPGRPDRTVGSVIATGTAGPLRHGFGSIRDHVLGCTLVTGDGRVLHPGGAVVKNVAGYDLTRLQVGAFGAFGVITEIHLRLRALPEADRTLLTHGTRDRLSRAGRDLRDAALDAAALELASPALADHPEWTLAARFTGSPEGVAAEADRLVTVTGLDWIRLEPPAARTFWLELADGTIDQPVTFRLGVLTEGIDETLDLLGEHLDLALVSAGAGSGTIRWSGEAGVDRLLALREGAARREIPLTLERAPWDFRKAVGHFGAYREGIGGLVENLRTVFDPSRVVAVALEGPRA